MLINIILLLLGLGLVSELMPKNKAVYLWSAVLMAAVCYAIYQISFVVSPDLKIIYPWIQTPNLVINVNFHLDSLNLKFVVSWLIFCLLIIINNSFYPSENAKNTINGLVLLNVVFMLLLYFSENFIQFLIALGACDVLVFSSINNVEAKKRYIYNNFLADMGILSIAAVIVGQTGSIELPKNIADFANIKHCDFIAILFLACVFMKSAMFMFHTFALEMSSLKFNRLNFILFFTSPLAGYFALQSMQEILHISEYSYPLLQIFSVATMFWGAWGAIAVDNIKKKSVYFTMLFWGFLYACIGFDKVNIFSHSIFIIAFTFAQTLMLVNNAASNEISVSKMGGFLKNIKFTFLISIITLFCYIAVIYSSIAFAGFVAWLFLVLLIVASAHVYGQIYLGESHAGEKVAAMLKNPSIFLTLPILTVAAVIAYYFTPISKELLLILIVWWLLFNLRALRIFDKFYDYVWLQQSKFVDSIYEMIIITPIKAIGRVLWLIVDFVLIERTILSSINQAFRFLVFLFRKLHVGSFYSYLLFVLLGAFIIIFISILGGR